MRKKKDEAARARDFGQKIATSLVYGWAKAAVKDFPERPTRKGKKKGALIGYPRSKMMVAYLSPLHPGLTLEEIGNLVGVSGDLLRVWRTEDLFKKTSERASDKFAAQFLNTLELKIESRPVDAPPASFFFPEEPAWGGVKLSGDDREFSDIELAELIPFFSPRVVNHYLNFLKKKLEDDTLRHAYNPIIPIILAVDQTFRVHNLKDYRAWLRRPQILNFYKNLIAEMILTLPVIENPEVGISENTLKYAKASRDMVWTLIDSLAK